MIVELVVLALHPSGPMASSDSETTRNLSESEVCWLQSLIDECWKQAQPKSSRDAVVRAWQKDIAEQAKTVRISKEHSAQVLAQLGGRLVGHLQDSFVREGTTSGIHAVQAISAGGSQTNLSFFKKAGQDTSVAQKTMAKCLHAGKRSPWPTKSNHSVGLYGRSVSLAFDPNKYENKTTVGKGKAPLAACVLRTWTRSLTENQVVELWRPVLEYATVLDVVDSMVVRKPPKVRPSWYQTYDLLQGWAQKEPLLDRKAAWMARLKLSAAKLARYRISPSEVTTAIMSSLEKSKVCASAHCVTSPLLPGVAYLFLDVYVSNMTHGSAAKNAPEIHPERCPPNSTTTACENTSKASCEDLSDGRMNPGSVYPGAEIGGASFHHQEDRGRKKEGEEEDERDRCFLFLDGVFLNSLGSMQVSGTVGLKHVTSERKSLAACVVGCESIVRGAGAENLLCSDSKSPSEQRAWKIHLSHSALNDAGASVSDVARFYQIALGDPYVIEVSKEEAHTFVVRESIPLPTSRLEETKSVKDPKERVFEIMSAHRAARRAITGLSDASDQDPTLLGISSHVTSIVCAGSSLKHVFTLPGIDWTRSYSNDPQELCSILGVEAVRTWLLWNLMKVSASNDQHLEWAYATLIVDHMLQRGTVVSSHAKTPATSILTSASMSSAVAHTSAAAAFGTYDDLSQASAAVTTGRLVNFGSAFTGPEPCCLWDT